MAEQTQYTIAIDSFNRDRTIYPEPNDFDLQINIAPPSLDFAQIYLGSLEFPVSQYTIEREWNTFYFDEGYAPISNDAATQGLRTITFTDSLGITREARIPLWLNPIIDVDTTDPTEPVFTTQWPHALNLARYYEDDDEKFFGSNCTGIKLISTPLKSPDNVLLTTFNPNFTVLNETQFSMANVDPGTMWVSDSGIFGYVHAPAIAPPNEDFRELSEINQIIDDENPDGIEPNVQRIVQEALDAAAPGLFMLSYNSMTNRYTIEASENVTLNINGTDDLLFVLGFGEIDIMLTANDPVEGMNGYQSVSSVEVHPGNYTPEMLAAAISFEYNRFYFDPGTDPMNPPPQPQFVFSTSGGNVCVIDVPFGGYYLNTNENLNPDLAQITLADYLQAEMNAKDPGKEYKVTMEFCPRVYFCFSSMNCSKFGLEFADPRDTVHQRLGFKDVTLRGCSTYKSSKAIKVALTRVSRTSLPFRLVSNLLNVKVDMSKKRFIFNPTYPRAFMGTATDIGNGLLEVSTATSDIAHGFQTEDVICLTIDECTYTFRVMDIISAFAFRVDYGSAPLSGIVDEPVGLSEADCPLLTMFQAPDTLTNSLRPSILGFPEGVFVCGGPLGQPCASPHVFSLDWPDYILLEVTQPDGGSYLIQHEWQGSLISNLFGKVVLYPPYRLERLYNIALNFESMTRIENIHFRILNPDHTLYNFHGRDWSATIIFITAVNYQFINASTGAAIREVASLSHCT